MAGDLYAAALSFLDGDAGDVRASVNAAYPGSLIAGSVTAARESKGAAPRKTNPPALGVEIVPHGRWDQRQIGIGFVEVDLVFDLRCTCRQKGLAIGKTQIQAVKNVALALLNRYDGVSNLTVPVSGATFRRSVCSVTSVDETPEANEQARAVARLVFTFSQDQAVNT